MPDKVHEANFFAGGSNLNCCCKYDANILKRPATLPGHPLYFCFP